MVEKFGNVGQYGTKGKSEWNSNPYNIKLVAFVDNALSHLISKHKRGYEVV